MTDRDRVVAEIVPPRAERSPFLADAPLADMVRKGLLAAPAAPGARSASGGGADHNVGTIAQDVGRGPRRQEICIDASVALDDRHPLGDFWDNTLAARRLIEYEVWTVVHARTFAEFHGDAATAILGCIALLALSPLCLPARTARFRTASHPRRPVLGIGRLPVQTRTDHRTRDVRLPNVGSRRPDDGYPMRGPTT